LTGSTGFADVSALAINSVGEVYAVTPSTPSTLLKIDAATGAGSVVGQMNIGGVHALAFDAQGMLYGATREINSVLYTIAIPGAQATVIDSTGVNCISGIAFSPLGVLYAVTSTNCSSAAGDQLYTLDTATAAATLVGTVGFSGSIPDIAFDLDGNLFGVIGDDAAQPHSLIAIDPSTAIGAYIGPLGFQAINGLSFFKADPTAVDDANEPPPAPATFALEQNYPNPFNPSTRIGYSISNASQVALKIYSLLGQQVRTLVDEKQNPNTYEVTWDGRDDGGVSMPTGIYFYQIRAGNEVATRRMLFLK